MGTFGANEADNYGGNGGGGFFSLKNDKDTAAVRFMYNNFSDVVGHAVHEVEIDGKKRYVNCLRNYNEPIDACPLCAAKQRVLAKLFVLLYDVDADEVRVWDRGKTFFSKMSSLCARYNPLVSTVFEIERNGKKGDTSTTYETYVLETDDTKLEDLPEVPEVLGTIVLDKTYEELTYFLDNGTFPEETSNTNNTNNARNPKTDNPPAAGRELNRRRRETPATNNRRTQDKF